LLDHRLEDEARRAGERAAAGGSLAGLSLSPVVASGPVAQHFGESEHRTIGELATTGPLGEAKTVELAPGYRVTYGEMIAMAGDHFEGIDRMRQMAWDPGPGAGTREEIEYVRVVKILGQGSAAFSDDAKQAADRRYYQLAADNPTHFPAPGEGDQDRPVGERAGDAPITGVRLLSLFPLRAELIRDPMNAVAAYHENHTRAIIEAAQAGATGVSIDAALATEAFSNHFLTDSFAGGHVRTARRSAFEYWNAKVPMFGFNLQGYLAEKVAEKMNEEHWYGTEEMFYSGPPLVAGALETIGERLAEQGVLTLGLVVVGAIHDYDNERGVLAMADGEEVLLKGDAHLGEGDEQRLAVAAVRASLDEVESAYRLGRAGVAPRALPGAIMGPYEDGLFAAERLLPRAVPDDEQLLRTDATVSVPWEFPSYQELLGNPLFVAALNTFAGKKADELTGLVANEREEARTAVGRITDRLKGGQAAEVVREVIESVPETGGGVFGHNEDDNAMDYIERASAVHGGLESMAVPQRVKLIRFLFSGTTFGDEEDAAYRVLTANPAHTQAVIDQVGWDELEDELGSRFSRAFPRR
jgi:hypothetical protein